MLKINEIFFSLQGESTYTGLPCIFVRLTGCNLRCSWCDTTYSFYEGEQLSKEEIIKKIDLYGSKLVEFTGGEPLLYKEQLKPIFKNLLEKGYTILVETNGTQSIKDIDKNIIKIVDYKCKSSGESGKFLLENLNYLNSDDQIKFPIADLDDFNEVVSFVNHNSKSLKAQLLISRVGNSSITHREIADLILKSGIKFRYQLQIHKVIWGDEQGR